MSITHAVLLTLLIGLLAISAFFSGTETAYFASNKIKIRHMAEEGNKQAALTRRLMENPGRLISIVLVGNNLVNIGATALATYMAINIFGDSGPGIATVVMTFLVLVFGEITPKTIMSSNPEKFALKVSKTINVLGIVLHPFIRMLNVFTGVFIRLFGVENAKANLVTEEEIRMLVNVGQEEGLLDEDEREMIDSIFEFDETVAREVMVPRIDIIGIDSEIRIDDAVELIVECGHSRIPVYDQSIDNIVGIIYAKDLLRQIMEDKQKGKPQVREMMRPAYYVPESKKVRELFAELRKSKVHMAIVLDEYGGTAGLITIEDLIEEIVGDIWDEFDIEKKQIEQLPDGSLRVDARTSIYDINECLEIELPDQDYDTISGLVFHQLGKLPLEGQELEIDGLKIIVEKVVGRRIAKLRLLRQQAGS